MTNELINQFCRIPARYQDAEPEKFILPAGKQGFIFYGDPGTGKTHKAIQYLKYYKSVYPEKHHIFFFDEVEYLKQIKQDILNEKIYTDEIKMSEFLVVDDLFSAKTTEFVDEFRYWLLNYLYKELKKFIITSNVDLNEMKQYGLSGSKIGSRLSENCIRQEFTKQWRN